MSEEFKCQFCGSTKLKYDTPYVTLNNEGEYVPTTKYCCKSQKQNHLFVKRFPQEERPSVEEVGEWD